MLRTLLLLPRVGPLGAVLIELPLILGIAWLVCSRILRRWPLKPWGAVGMGGVALALLLLGEASISVLLANRTLTEHLRLYNLLPERLGLAGQLVFAGFPWVQARMARAGE